jgi:hypothetical protein
MDKYLNLTVRIGLLFFILTLVLSEMTVAQTTGKITGIIKDAATGEPLPGVNVSLEGTNLGAASDLEGYYVILNIPVGSHEVKVSMIGYKAVTKTDVLVSIDRITTLNFELEGATIEGEEIVIVAEREILHKEVSNSQQVITQDQIIQAAGVRSIIDYLAKQAGITDDEYLGIRGGTPEQTGALINGLTFVDASLGRPQTSIPLSAVEQVSVITGGFNAEHGNFRSGIINVVTKTGSQKNYSGQINFSTTNATPKRFGKSAYDPYNWLLRPYLDPSVAFEGTGTAWAGDEYKQQQYRGFRGWNIIAERFNRNRPADQQVAPLDLYLVTAWMFQTVPDFDALEKAGYTVSDTLQEALKDHANPGEGDGSDWQFDGGFGGPIPFIGKYLGDATFYISNQTSRQYYVQPVIRDNEFSSLTMLTLKSKITDNLSIRLNGFYRDIEGVSSNRSAWDDRPSGSGEDAGRGGLMRINNLETWVNDEQTYWLYPTFYSEMDVYTTMAGLTLNHVVNPNTFWDLSVSYLTSHNKSYYKDNRDHSVRARFGPISVTEMPYGRYAAETSYMVENWEWNYYEQPEGVTERFNNKGGNLHDDSNERQFRLKFGLSGQVNSNNLLKAGLEYNYIHLDQFQWKYRPGYLYNTWEFVYNRKPWQFGAYLQDQITFESMVANLGIRLDYYNGGGGYWPDGDLFAQEAWEVRDPDDLLDMLNNRESHIWSQLDAYAEENPGFYKKIENHLVISPRLGISFPVTERSKVYFNYGHFRSTVPYSQMYLNTYRFSEKNTIEEMGNPSLEPPRTIAYELGVDYNLLDQYLVHIAGFYKDITGQHGDIRYENSAGILKFDYRSNNNYQDIQGVELTVTKQIGTWLTGWLNYRYLIEKSGHVGRSDVTEENVNNQQEGLYQGDESRPKPRPEFTANINLHTPQKWGPEILGHRVFEDWNLSILPTWRKGDYFTWNPLSKLHVENNMNWPDYYMVDLRLSKYVRTGLVNFTLYLDVDNVFNIKVSHLHRGYPFADAADEKAYLASLHLPMYDSEEYDALRELNPGLYVAGNDEIGDFRSDNKPYINDPNRDFLMYGEKRQIWFGLKIDF